MPPDPPSSIRTLLPKRLVSPPPFINPRSAPALLQWNMTINSK